MISIITVGMNHKKYIEALYESLFSSIPAGCELEVIYVDNCSKDDSVGFIQAHYPQVKIIQNDTPLGFGENNNKGVLVSKGDFIGIVNPDIVFKEDSLKQIVSMMGSQLSHNSIVAPQLLNIDLSHQYSVRKFVTLGMILNRWLSKGKDDSENARVKEYLYKDMDVTQTQEVDWAMGAALFMSRDVFSTLGGFDLRYFLYMEDEDLCLRAWKHGVRVLYYPKIELIHNHLRGSSHLSKKTWLHFQSLMKFFLQHGININRSNF